MINWEVIWLCAAMLFLAALVQNLHRRVKKLEAGTGGCKHTFFLTHTPNLKKCARCGLEVKVSFNTRNV